LRTQVGASIKNGELLLDRILDSVREFRSVGLGDQSVVERFVGSLIRKSHIGALALKPKIVLYQTISMLTAAVEINPKYIVKALASLSPKRVGAEIREHSESGKVRLDGGGHQILTSGSQSPAIQEFLGKKPGVIDRFGMGAIHAGDTAVMHVIWGAAKAEGTDMGMKDAELMEYTARRFEEIVRRTQPNWNTTSLASLQLWARKSALRKLIPGLPFSSQRAMNANMTYRAISEFKHSDKTAGDYAKLTAKVGVANVGNAIGIYGTEKGVDFLVHALLGGGEDDDDLTLKGVASEITSKILGNYLTLGDLTSVAMNNIPWLGKKKWEKVPRRNILASAVVDAYRAAGEAMTAIDQTWTGEEYDGKQLAGQRKAFYSWVRAGYYGARAAGMLRGLPTHGALQPVRHLIPFGPKRRSRYYKRLWRALGKDDKKASLQALQELSKLHTTVADLRASATRFEKKRGSRLTPKEREVLVAAFKLMQEAAKEKED